MKNIFSTAYAALLNVSGLALPAMTARVKNASPRNTHATLVPISTVVWLGTISVEYIKWDASWRAYFEREEDLKDTLPQVIILRSALSTPSASESGKCLLTSFSFVLGIRHW